MTLFERLKSELARTLQGIGYTVEALPENRWPLFMLLTLDHDKVAFSTINFLPDQNDKISLEQFRKLYADNSVEWAKYELSLVLCQSDEIPLDFRTKVEVDPYFCRKFVIDPRDLETEFKRLSFIPLSVLKQVSERPISAQSYLARHGMPVELAKQIVVPHIKGNERIIEDCLLGEWGLLDWNGSFKAQFTSFPELGSGNRVQIKQLEIQGFRGYREKIEFDLESDIIVLFGPNGFGKTSFFDAIDFVCTGSVARFDYRFNRNEERIIQSLKHLDSSIDDSYVSAILSLGGKDIPIKRTLVDRNKATIDGSLESRKQTLLKITGISASVGDVRIENLVRLFQATHLFGQEFQSLTCDFRKESTLNEEIVARMLALQDYVQAIEKSNQILNELNRRTQATETKVDEAKFALIAIQEKLSKSGQLDRLAAQPNILSSITKELGQRLRTYGLEEGELTLDEGTVRGFRSVVSAKMASVESLISATKELSGRYNEFVSQNEAYVEIVNKMKQSMDVLNNIIIKGEDLATNIVSIKTLSSDKLIEGNSLTNEKRNLEWLLDKIPLLQTLNNETKKLEGEYNRDIEQIGAIASRLAFLQSQSESFEATIKDTKTDIFNLENRVVVLNQLPRVIIDWKNDIERSQKTEASLQTIEVALTEVENGIIAKYRDFDRAKQRLQTLETDLTGLAENRTQLMRLLTELEKYADSNSCPACGANYASQNELIERLRKIRGKEDDNFANLRDLYNEAKIEFSKANTIYSDALNDKRVYTSNHEEIESDLKSIRERIIRYKRQLFVNDIDGNVSEAGEAIDIQKQNALKLIDDRNKGLNDIIARKLSSEKEIEQLKSRVSTLSATIRENINRRDTITSRLADISREASNRAVSTLWDQVYIGNRLIDIEKLLLPVQKEMASANSREARLRDELDQSNRQKLLVENEIASLSSIKAKTVKRLEEFNKLLVAVGLSRLEINEIRDLETHSSRQLGELKRLFDDISELEMAIDYSEMSAMVARNVREKQELEQVFQVETKNRENLYQCKSYFEGIKKDLEKISGEALGKYIDSFGPLSATIQKRLRSVYGFGDVHLNMQKGKIVADVERTGFFGLSPSDFFSEAQIQIAMLSLFLSANLTQNWSQFSPILLDDPVEHFDDLNAYALVGLIKRLASKRMYGRQFIVSTCDDRLFRLMRQQFGSMDSKVVYYRFTAFGENGPMIERSYS